jgi:hypothetical protein
MVKFLIKRKTIAIVVIILLFLVLCFSGYFLYRYFVLNKTNDYFIKNKYYGFEIKIPKDWTAEGKTIYSEDNINQLLAECKRPGGYPESNEPSVYEVGRFRFKSQKYPQNLGEGGYFQAGFPNGAILDITINCIPDGVKNKIIDYSYGALKIGGEKAFGTSLNLLGFGNTKYFSLFHDNLQYRINEYVYTSSAPDKNFEEKLRENYAYIFKKIISSFKFIR